MQVLVLPGIADATKAAEIGVLGTGSPRAKAGRHRHADHPRMSTPPSSAGGSFVGHAQPAQPQPSPQRNLVQVSGLVNAVIDGRTSANDFARVLAARADDSEWLTALGLALNDLGAVIESGKSGAMARQKAQTVAATRAAQQRQDALDKAIAERDDIAAKATKLEAEALRLKEEHDFASLFSPPPKPAESSKGGAFASVIRRAREQALVEKGAANALASVQAQMGAASRKDRISMQKEMQRQHDATAKATLEMKTRAHKEAMRRMEDRLREAEHEARTSEGNRNEIHVARRKKEMELVSHAEAEAEKLRRSEGRARAQASAAAEVLAETQTEVRLLREELERVRLALQVEKSANEHLNATNESMEATVNRLREALHRAPSSGYADAAAVTPGFGYGTKTPGALAPGSKVLRTPGSRLHHPAHIHDINISSEVVATPTSAEASLEAGSEVYMVPPEAEAPETPPSAPSTQPIEGYAHMSMHGTSRAAGPYYYKAPNTPPITVKVDFEVDVSSYCNSGAATAR